MATRKTPEERVAKIEERMAQLEAQKKDIIARDKAEKEKKLKAAIFREFGTPDRSARAHRLIEIGAEVEAALGYTLDTPEMRKRCGDFLRKQNANGGWADKAIKG